MRPARLPYAVLVASAFTLLALHACQDVPEPTAPELATAPIRHQLTITGSGNGTGVVTSSPAGINCTITSGVAATTGCKALFNKGVLVTLTANPNAGHAFQGWFNFCKGIGVCKTAINSPRTVKARFGKGPFTIKVSGGSTGAGRGTVRSQPGLTPAINCVITDGVAAATGCSAKYPANTVLTLTATPASGNSFGGWGAPCTGFGACEAPVIQTRTISATFRGGAGPEATQGRWESLFSTPVVGIHTHLLPTGKVLLWGETGESQLWDPANPNGGFTQVNNPYEVFCSGHTFLPDGRLLVAGGHIGEDRGLPMAAIFNPSSGDWTRTTSMERGRWYPTTTTLPDGDVLVVAGADENGGHVATPEVWNGSGWRHLTTAELTLPYYPTMFVAPNGKVFLAGPDQMSRYLDVSGTGDWTTVAERNVPNRAYGSAVMYAPGKILYAGGGDPPTASAEVIDLNQSSPSWRSVPGMQYRRRQMMATVLADGKVLVTHGTSGTGFNDLSSVVHYAELWNPATESWTTMAREASIRAYHSTAVLLPDGRVFSSGSGEGGGVGVGNSQFSAQVFSPPYLFNQDGSLATRPTISSAPARLGYGESFTVETPNAGSVTGGNLVRLSSATHTFNMSQAIYPLTFSATGSATLSASAPASGRLAPPGPYMLFLVNDNGVPSMAKMVTVGP
ncbi:MAG: galactose oxidase-like domain-containing protein [Gemmatimonadales bacterium]